MTLLTILLLAAWTFLLRELKIWLDKTDALEVEKRSEEFYHKLRDRINYD